MLKIIFQQFLLDNSQIVWELLSNAVPVFPFNSIADKVCVGFVRENISSLEAHLKASYYCRVSELLSKSRLIIYLIAYDVPATVNKKNFIALIQLSSYNLSFLKEPNLQTFHYTSNEKAVSMVIKCNKWVFYISFLNSIFLFGSLFNRFYLL